jgi:hypothetical protein
MLEGNIPTLEATTLTTSNNQQLQSALILGGFGVSSRLQQPTDPADLIHLLQKLHIPLLEAGVIGAHVLFCESLDNPLKIREPTFPKNEKSTQIL